MAGLASRLARVKPKYLVFGLFQFRSPDFSIRFIGRIPESLFAWIVAWIAEWLVGSVGRSPAWRGRGPDAWRPKAH